MAYIIDSTRTATVQTTEVKKFPWGLLFSLGIAATFTIMAAKKG